MKVPYEKERNNLHEWVKNTNNLISKTTYLCTAAEAQKVQKWIHVIATNLNEEYSFYSVELYGIANILFSVTPYNPYGMLNINVAAFGELFIIMKHIVNEPMNIQFWKSVHPRIINISKDLYCEGHFDSAAEKAVKEVETRLRELFQELKPGINIPGKIGDIIGALLSENGAYKVCDVSTVSGQDYRRGIYSLFQGIFAAYRNPAAHANIPCTKRAAIEQIMLASQLMYVLDGSGN